MKAPFPHLAAFVLRATIRGSVAPTPSFATVAVNYFDFESQSVGVETRVGRSIDGRMVDWMMALD